jgi:DNA-binding NarL/FixJ family response regulator
VRVAIADDEVLLREGLARLLVEVGLEVVANVGDAPALLSALGRQVPDVVVIDIKMPPTFTDEGIVLAMKVRDQHPSVGVLVLSHYLDSRYAMRLMEHHPAGVGYLLKERVSDVVVLVDALRRVAEGECVVDPTIVARLMRKQHDQSPVGQLTDRERDVLTLMAEGHSNLGIARRLMLSPKTVERHIGHIFDKLALEPEEDHHRRVLAVLLLLRSS